MSIFQSEHLLTDWRPPGWIHALLVLTGPPERGRDHWALLFLSSPAGQMPQWHENLFHFISIISLIRLEINPLIDWSVPNEAQVSWLSFSWELLAPGAGTAHLSFRWTTRAWTWSNRVSVKVCVQHNQFIHLQRLVCNLKLSDECSTRSKCSWIIKAVEPVLEVYWNKKQVNHNTPELPGRRPGDRWRNTVALCRSEEPFF